MSQELMGTVVVSSEMNEVLLEYSLRLFEIKQLLRELRQFIISLSLAYCDPSPSSELYRLHMCILEAQEPVNAKIRDINDRILLLSQPFTDDAFYYLDFAKNLWKEIQEKVQRKNNMTKETLDVLNSKQKNAFL